MFSFPQWLVNQRIKRQHLLPPPPPPPPPVSNRAMMGQTFPYLASSQSKSNHRWLPFDQQWLTARDRAVCTRVNIVRVSRVYLITRVRAPSPSGEDSHSGLSLSLSLSSGGGTCSSVSVGSHRQNPLRPSAGCTHTELSRGTASTNGSFGILLKAWPHGGGREEGGIRGSGEGRRW